jgi:hypothetical protein
MNKGLMEMEVRHSKMWITIENRDAVKHFEVKRNPCLKRDRDL